MGKFSCPALPTKEPHAVTQPSLQHGVAKSQVSNAPSESFLGTLKQELMLRSPLSLPLASHADAMSEIRKPRRWAGHLIM